MKSVMKNRFADIPRADIQRSSFDRSHGYKTTFNASDLIPIFVDEALPGDTFNLNLSAFARLATPIKPIMDNMYMETFFFAVPNRLLWDNWQKFNGEQRNPGESTDFLVPQMEPALYPEFGLGDYFGLPVNRPNIIANALHHRAYNLIWNEWFRDQNLQDSLTINTGDGPDLLTDYGIKKRGKRHDYFTSCLPFPQKGPSVEIGIGPTAPITGIGPVDSDGNNLSMIPSGGVSGNIESTLAASGGLYVVGSPSVAVPTIWDTSGLHMDADDPTSTLVADLSQATAITINALRESFQIQKLYERDARGGTRYTEIIKSHFGVTSPDSRLQRPEYLGGGSSPVNISPITQTTQSVASGDTPQGNLAAIGTTSFSGHSFTKSFTEHCVIIGLVNVRADLTYQEGVNRMFSRQTRFDYYWPALSHLGEQEVLNKEIYSDGSAADDEIFGYQERYAEYRYKPSQITGQFRSGNPLSLDVWHLSQDFENLPTLSAEFIEEDVPIERVVAVPTEPDFIFDSYFKLKCARPMPAYSVPGLIDHF